MNGGAARVLEGAALPSSLRDLPEPPVRLFVHGHLPRGPCVGIVGTRLATAEARDYARELAFRLAKRGVAIVSGGAEGIDAAAHQGALDAGGVTLVVAPSSFDRPYPAEHAGLFAEVVARGGGYVSPFASGVEPRRHQFFERNSHLVALSHALIVVEAPLRSGARNAALWARRLQRRCFIVPSAPWNVQGLGCIAELQLGGRALASHEEVLRWLEERQLHAVRPEPFDAHPTPAEARPRVPPERLAGSPPARPPKKSRPKRAATEPVESDSERAILDAVRAGARHPDQIGALAALTASEVSHGLLLLTLKGAIVMGEAGDVTITR